MLYLESELSTVDAKNEKEKPMNRNHNVSTGSLILLFVIVFVIANVAFAIAMAVMGEDAAMVKEFAMKTGIIVLVNSVLLILVDCCTGIEKKIWDRKNETDCFAGETYQLLKCSPLYFMLPIATILIDIMMVVMAWPEYQENPQALIADLMQDRKTALGFFVYAVVFHVYSIYVIFRYCGYKVYYTRTKIVVSGVFRKKNILWSEVRSIEHHYVTKKKRQELVLKTRDDKIVFRSDILNDGWEMFLSWTESLADLYQIGINGAYHSYN